MKEIIQKDNAILRKTAKEVPLADIPSVKIQDVIANMKEALAGEGDGVAIAAPQIAVSLRIFVVSHKVFGEEGVEDERTHTKDIVFINPEITKQSKKLEWMDEGCLSVRWLYGSVKRATKTTVRAYDENGNIFTHNGSGLLAEIFQHEIDHLNGILFIDTAKELEEIPPEDKEKKEEETK